jgi:ABC-type nickel/cobalt efflux system permease component RcnA
MNNGSLFLTVFVTAAITLILHRLYDPGLLLGLAMAIGTATVVATLAVTGHALMIRFGRKGDEPRDGQA